MNNFVLYSSFSLTLTVRGVSNKHCLLTFFIGPVVSEEKMFEIVDGRTPE